LQRGQQFEIKTTQRCNCSHNVAALLDMINFSTSRSHFSNLWHAATYYRVLILSDTYCLLLPTITPLLVSDSGWVGYISKLRESTRSCNQ